MSKTAVTIKDGSLDGSKLDNAASEYTLAHIKDVIERMEKAGMTFNTKKTQKEFKKLTDNVENATTELDEFGDEVSEFRQDLGRLRRSGIRALGKAFGALYNTMGSLGGVVANLSNQMLTSRVTTVDFTEAVRDSSLNVLGLGTALDLLANYIYSNYTSFQELSRSGIVLNAEMMNMAAHASVQNITSESLVDNLIQSAERLAILGGASEGATRALKINTAVTDEQRRTLLNWGVSYDEQAEMLTSFISQNARMIKDRVLGDEEIAKLSSNYAKNLRILSNITGKNVDEHRRQMEEMNLNAAFESFLSTVNDPEIREQMRASVVNISEMSEGAAQAMMSKMMGLPPTTEAAIAAMGLIPGIVEHIDKNIRLSTTFSGKTEEFGENLARLNTEYANKFEKQAKDMAQLAFVLDSQGSVYGAASQDFIRFVNKFKGWTEEQLASISKEPEIPEEIKAAQDFDEALRKARRTLNELVVSFFGNPSVRKGFDLLGNFVSTFDPMMYNPFDEEGRKNIYDSFNQFWNGERMQALIDDVAKWFQDLFDKMSSTILREPFGGLYGTSLGERNLSQLIEKFSKDPSSLNGGEKQDLFQTLRKQSYPDKSFWFSDLFNFGADLPDSEFRKMIKDYQILNNMNTETRRIGTLRATGMPTEPRDTTARIHAGERVLNPQEAATYNTQPRYSNQNQTITKLDQLNNTMNRVVALMQEEIRVQTKTMHGVKNMGTDLLKSTSI